NGQSVQSVEYGFQIEDMPIGRVAGQWQLLSNATPSAVNATLATLGSTTNLAINEWFANPLDLEPDWFELYNRDALPVNLGGLFLTDDPSLAGLTKNPVSPLSFVAGNGWVTFIADGERGAGRDHVNFLLGKDGELLRIYNTNLSTIDTVSFGAQGEGVSQGRLPDGGSNVVSFPLTPTPGGANYLPHSSIVVNEVLTHTDLPLEDAIELRNEGSNPVAIGGWWISNAERTLRKFQIPLGTPTLAPGQFIVFYENQFNSGGTGVSPNFTLNSAHGDSVYVSETDANGNFTGHRAQVSFGAAANGASIGRFSTSVGVDFTALAERTFGQDNPVDVAQFRGGAGLPNSYAKIGPVIFNEINYHPVTVSGNGLSESADEEFVELHNTTTSALPLYDPAHPTNTWRIAGGLSFKFATNQSIAARGYLVLVAFDPATNAAALANFRTKYGTNGTIAGPFSGRLRNSSDVIELYRPDVPQAPPHLDAGFVPQILVDRVAYSDLTPWPSSADGGGASLQRLAMTLYGNDPANWKAEPATVGTTNSHVGDVGPTITTQPTNITVELGATAEFYVGVAGTPPFSYQWQRFTTNLPGAIGATLTLNNVQPSQAGTYRVVVTNHGGNIISASATLTVLVPPTIIAAPTNFVAIEGSAAQFAVTASGTAPLFYQWRRNNSDILGANSAQYLIPTVHPGDAANYSVLVSNSIGVSLSSFAALFVIVPPSITGHPAATNVLVNSPVTFTVSASGTAPLAYQWRKNDVNIPGANGAAYFIPSAQSADEGIYSVIVSNTGGSAPSAAAQLIVAVAPVLGVPHALVDGTFTFTLFGQSNRSYDLYSSSNLTAWSNFATITLTNTSMPVLDTSASNAPGRFYRARLVP
ncbi:MAG TPA: immunoglobulin domain-containing protein, partial [Candidatus Acidoferrum sp.]|nr:immunoglobulin domain-containing protein [Candidatus Acidoferrum sp.]